MRQRFESIGVAIAQRINIHLEENIFIFLVSFRVYLLSELDDRFKVSICLFFLIKNPSKHEMKQGSNRMDRRWEGIKHTLGARGSVFSMIEVKENKKKSR